ncbi:MAG: hypothetical protein OQJ97_18570 [Rhodospirillales bacterium]|nr:hypothetical protein [Rhodospirillales bacterium]
MGNDCVRRHRADEICARDLDVAREGTAAQGDVPGSGIDAVELVSAEPELVRGGPGAKGNCAPGDGWQDRNVATAVHRDGIAGRRVPIRRRNGEVSTVHGDVASTSATACCTICVKKASSISIAVGVEGEVPGAGYDECLLQMNILMRVDSQAVGRPRGRGPGTFNLNAADLAARRARGDNNISGI